MARSLLGLKRYQEALALLTRRAEMCAQTRDEDAWIDLGLCLEGLGRTQEAQECYRRGSPMYGRTWLHQALVCKQSGQTNDAREYFGRATECFNAQLRVGMNSAAALLEIEQAREKLRELDPERFELLEADHRRRLNEKAAPPSP